MTRPLPKVDTAGLKLGSSSINTIRRFDNMTHARLGRLIARAQWGHAIDLERMDDPAVWRRGEVLEEGAELYEEGQHRAALECLLRYWDSDEFDCVLVPVRQAEAAETAG